MTCFVVSADRFSPSIIPALSTAAIATGVRQAHPDAEIIQAPLIDGGPGTSITFAGETITLPTLSADGQLAEASYILDEDNATAYIDAVPAAIGTGTAPTGIHTAHPPTGDSYGTGVLIADALSREVKTIVLSVDAGNRTNTSAHGATTFVLLDGGVGILQALGLIPQDGGGKQLAAGSEALTQLDNFDANSINMAAVDIQWIIYSTQTATFADLTADNPGLRTFAEVATRDGMSEDIAHVKGSAAGGGIPFGLGYLTSIIGGTVTTSSPIVSSPHFQNVVSALTRDDTTDAPTTVLLVTASPDPENSPILAALKQACDNYPSTADNPGPLLEVLTVPATDDPTEIAAALRAAGATV
ncbi:MAG: glycerate kinase [Corynebacterium sp.]|nr:glycerate kinase [Corynebacterium sp.]